MPESTGSSPSAGSSPADLDEIADALYALPPDAFVPARDDRVAEVRQAGDRELARAVGRLRRPTRAAWLANLLARHRTEQLDGLVALAGTLAQAQQNLDGDALRALSGQRHRAVAAMARDAGRLAARQGEPVTDALLRELQGILDAALADPQVAEEVRAGRLTKTVRYSGFGPAAGGDAGDDDMAAWTASAPDRRRTARPAPPADEDDAAPDDAADNVAADDRAAERAERERAEQERAERERELAEAEAAEAAARDRQEADEAARDRADERHGAARERVAELTAALDAARADEQSALEAVRAAATAARDSARDAATAAVTTARARARLEQLPRPGSGC